MSFACAHPPSCLTSLALRHLRLLVTKLERIVFTLRYEGVNTMRTARRGGDGYGGMSCEIL